MTVAVALVDPPREGLVLPEIAAETALSPGDARDLYEAMLADFFDVAADANVDVLVNYPTPDRLPDGDGDPAAEIRSVAASVLDREDLSDLRFEVQVGSSPSARIGNAITHLLRDEEETSAALIDHRAPLLDRSVIDQAAISLRRSEVVLGPSGAGGVHLAGFTEPIDFTDVLEDVPLETIVDRAREADASVDFVRRRDVATDPRTLGTVVATIRARAAAGASVPPRTTAAIEDLGLALRDGDLVVDEPNR
ncbi:MAG: DUF2064 domain-containing protein [Halanaeroarchaeum sp.]